MPVSSWLGTEDAVVQAPGDLAETDEMAPQPPPRRARRPQRHQPAALATVAKYSPAPNFVASRKGITNPDLVWNLHPPSVAEMTAGRPPQQVVDEYDEDLNIDLGKSQRRSADAPVVQPAELPTREEKDRLSRGDVEHFRPPPRPHPPRRLGRRAGARPPRRRRLLAAQRHAQTARAAAAGAGHARGMPPGHEQMLMQCIGFATWLKSQNATGTELVGLWKNTCNQGGGAGGVSDQYQSMCSALVGAVSEFADDPNWTPHVACEDVLRVFRESGVGGSPLKGL